MLDFLGPLRDFGPDAVSSRCGDGDSNILTFVFCKVPLAALLRMGWREILKKAALAVVQARGGGGLA